MSKEAMAREGGDNLLGICANLHSGINGGSDPLQGEELEYDLKTLVIANENWSKIGECDYDRAVRALILETINEAFIEVKKRKTRQEELDKQKLVKVRITTFKETGKYNTHYEKSIDKNKFDSGHQCDRIEEISKAVGFKDWNEHYHLLIQNINEDYANDEYIYRLITKDQNKLIKEHPYQKIKF